MQAALDVFDPEQRPLPPELAGKVLRALGLNSIAVLAAGGRREIASTSPPPMSVVDVTHEENSFTLTISELYRALFPAVPSTIRMRSVDPPLELTMDEKPLTTSLRRVASAQFVILVVLAVVITIVVWATLWQMVLRPVRKLTSNIIAFGERPQDVSRIIAPSGRDDEIGRAEKALAAMQELARARARTTKAPGRARHGGRAHQPRPAQHAFRGAAHLRSSRDDCRPAGPAASPRSWSPRSIARSSSARRP